MLSNLMENVFTTTPELARIVRERIQNTATMDAYQQFISSEAVEEKYHEVIKLHTVEAVNDPESDPYRSKYKSREILCELKKLSEKYNDENDRRWLYFEFGLDYLLGVNFMETDELSTGQEHLLRVVEALDSEKLSPNVCNLLQKTYNQLGILWTGRRQNEKAKECLEEAEGLYKKFTHEVGGAPHMLEELFVIKKTDEDGLIKERSFQFEDTYTHTMYYLAQVYGKLDEKKLSAEYCHTTLQRQLDNMSYTPLEWALNAATLSQYYITENDFPMARHSLAAASLIIKEAGDPKPLSEEDEQGTQESDNEKLVRSHADIKRCWIKYGLALLEASRDRLLQAVEDDHPEVCLSTEESNENKSSLYFNLELTVHEDQITGGWVKTYEDARPVFLSIVKWVNDAKEYYVSDQHCTDYVEIVQDNSKAYKFLAFFDPDFERQCKMHKRRVDMLTSVHKELNPQYYMLICRQLIYETAETISTMLDLKLAVIEETNNPPNAHAWRKINTLAAQSIQKFEEYLRTLHTSDKKLPEKFASDDERPALVAHFCIGRLYSKFLHFEVRQRLANLKMSLEYYKYIVDYCKRNPESVDNIKNERDICEEMVALLPAKMDRIRAQEQ